MTSAIAELRGILAATRTRAQIDALMDQVLAELTEQTQPVPYQLTAAGGSGGDPSCSGYS